MSLPTLDQQRTSYQEAFPFHDENHLMLSHYAGRMLASMAQRPIKHLASLGIGQHVVCDALLAQVPAHVQKYTLVEGSLQAIQEMKLDPRVEPHVRLVHSYFEDFHTDEPFDAIEAGFVLEHVDDPLLVLKRFAQFLEPGGKVYLAVPNAQSLHRRIGHAAGLLPDMYQLSAADVALGHQRYFDAESFTGLVEEAGLQVVALEGVYCKPLTTGQLRALNLSDAIYKALCAVGQDYPELCNALYIEAQR
jgi:2-polyprenyl-3-methyl-5-hydroxy-6-metoxy-1,4-benzoquinol methylase